jgi:predicted N-formylglutamate amidohydrolase
MKETILILSCEHASNHLPQQWQHLLSDLNINEELMQSFAAFDPFAKELTLNLAKKLNCDFILGQLSRLLIDLNKSSIKDHCFPEHVLQKLTPEEKTILLQQYYDSYRQQFESLLDKHIQQDEQVLHLSIHTFNPVEKGIEHNAAIGLLYDPHRHGEKEVARVLNEILSKRTNFKVRLNYPRTGKADNYTSFLRKNLNESSYIGIELECNALLLKDPEQAEIVYENLYLSINSLLELL